jgi:hypothetical protein
MTDVNAMNAVLQEQARIRKEVCELPTAKIGLGGAMIARKDVLAIIRNSKTPMNGDINTEHQEG